jgi:hypothetical protein
MRQETLVSHDINKVESKDKLVTTNKNRGCLCAWLVLVAVLFA